MKIPKSFGQQAYGKKFVSLDVSRLDRPGSPTKAWRNSWLIVQLFLDHGYERLTVQRIADVGVTDALDAGLTWDQLMIVKNNVGFGDRWAIEIYPPLDEIHYACNMRHLWLLNEAPPQAWIRGGEKDDAA